MISDLREKVIRVLFVALVAWLLQSCVLAFHSYSQVLCKLSKRHQVCGGLCEVLVTHEIKDVGTLKLGYPLLLYKDTVPMRLLLVAW